MPGIGHRSPRCSSEPATPARHARCSSHMPPPFSSPASLQIRQTKMTGAGQSFLFVVEMPGKLSNRVKDYLSRFWIYYESRPNLQKALGNA